ncbi:MAG: glycosyltransferase family 9 protein [Desulfobulbaceae bacterium]|nr:glycosyltransferase family 9 protein [Desulfobulbaceae bacterium]HIJ91451.1 glycosyltransferase family 9 protein [Deltaproteobacteria bacterium]
MALHPRRMKGGGALPFERTRTLLLIQLGDIGDVVYSFPCARALKEIMPEVKLIFAVQQKAAGLVEGCRWADGVIPVGVKQRGVWKTLIHQWRFWRDVRRYHFDLAIDLRTGTRGAILAFLSGASFRLAPYALDGTLWRNRLFSHLVMPSGKKHQFIVEHYLEIMMPYGIDTEKLFPEISVSSDRLAEADRLLASCGLARRDKVVAVQPFSLWGYKEWQKEKMAALIRQVHEDHGLPVLIIGGPDERARAEELAALAGDGVINLAGQTSIALLPAVLRECCLFIGVDSAGLHIAAAVGVPTIGLYGPSGFATWAPKGEGHVVVHKKIPCVPCRQKGCGGSLKSRCMDELGVDEVYSAVQNQLVSLK